MNRARIFLVIGTNKKVIGKLVIELFNDIVPKTVKNFMTLVKTKYKNTIFHRIIPGFMVQGGDFTAQNGTGGYSIYGKHFEDENFKIKHAKPGLLSMANSGPNTNGSQFFITFAETPWLDNKHVVFGRIIDGMDTLYSLEKYGSESGNPTNTIKIIDCGLENK